jgi:DNA gyrase inhibitor GyrI
VAGVFLALLTGVGGACMAVERAKYTVELSEPPYEVRDYDPMVVASVHVDGDRSNAVSAGFRILANYIFGNNQGNGKIAMTAPVEQQSLASGWDVSFMMPAGYTMSTLPLPNDARVTRVPVPRHRAAVVRFSGFWSDANLQTHETQLLQWVKLHHLVAVASPTYAYYDPPWTPWFLRTIEVMVDIES